jgi:hypothetical protein
MRKYVCPQIHIMEFEDHNSRDVFCKLCNSWYKKYQIYIFQWNEESQRFYLSALSAKPKDAKLEKETKRLWYQKNKERHLQICAEYRTNRKQKLLEVA